MGQISGLFTLGQQQGGVGTNTDEWVSEFQDTILVRNARGIGNGSTLFGLMSRLKNEPVETTEYKWFERDPAIREIQVDNQSTAYTSSDTTIFVDDGSVATAAAGGVAGVVQIGTILRTSFGEQVRVTGGTSAGVAVANASGRTQLTITRAFNGVAGTGGAGLADNNKLVVLTLGQAEGANPIAPVYQTPTTLVNYIQTYNAAVSLTNAFKGSKLRTDLEGPLRERRIQALERITRDIELSFFFGTKSVTQATTGNLYYTGGITNSIDQIATSPTQVLAGGGSGGVALATFNAWMASFLTLGSDAKIAFCGPQAYAAISNYANAGTNGYRITGQESVYGMNITEINTPFGQLSMTMHPLFKEISTYNDWMVVVDLGLLVQKVMEPLFLEPNIQTPGQDTYLEQFRGKYGVKLKFPQAFGYATALQKLT